MKKPGKYSKGDLIYWEDAEQPYQIGESEVYSSCWQAQQLILTSNTTPKDGDKVINTKGNSIHDYSEEMCTGDCKRIEAAYPTIEGIPPISHEFMEQFCKANGKGVVWCEINRIIQTSKGDLIIPDNVDESNCVYDRLEPRLDQSGFIVLNLESEPERGITITTKNGAISEQDITIVRGRPLVCTYVWYGSIILKSEIDPNIPFDKLDSFAKARRIQADSFIAICQRNKITYASEQ